MARIEWLIADLRRQRRNVAEAAARAQMAGYALQASKQRFFARIIRQPGVLVGSFIAGILLGLPRTGSKRQRGRSAGWAASLFYWIARLFAPVPHKLVPTLGARNSGRRQSNGQFRPPA
jgi:hypothetical protein